MKPASELPFQRLRLAWVKRPERRVVSSCAVDSSGAMPVPRFIERPLVAALLIATVVCLPGCRVWYNAERTLIHEPKRYHWGKEQVHDIKTYEGWAAAAWVNTLGDFPQSAFNADYEKGFFDGFVEYVYAGGTGEPPPIPPREYWKTAFRNAIGDEAVGAWRNGFRHGARVALDGGYRQRATVPVTGVGVKNSVAEANARAGSWTDEANRKRSSTKSQNSALDATDGGDKIELLPRSTIESERGALPTAPPPLSLPLPDESSAATHQRSPNARRPERQANRSAGSNTARVQTSIARRTTDASPSRTSASQRTTSASMRTTNPTPAATARPRMGSAFVLNPQDAVAFAISGNAAKSPPPPYVANPKPESEAKPDTDSAAKSPSKPAAKSASKPSADATSQAPTAAQSPAASVATQGPKLGSPHPNASAATDEPLSIEELRQIAFEEPITDVTLSFRETTTTSIEAGDSDPDSTLHQTPSPDPSEAQRVANASTETAAANPALHHDPPAPRNTSASQNTTNPERKTANATASASLTIPTSGSTASSRPVADTISSETVPIKFKSIKTESIEGERIDDAPSHANRAAAPSTDTASPKPKKISLRSAFGAPPVPDAPRSNVVRFK